MKGKEKDRHAGNLRGSPYEQTFFIIADAESARKDNMTRCRKCGKEIIWIKTVNGKNMPCDPGKHRFKLQSGNYGKVYIEPSGETVHGIESAAGENEGYIPHWATCPVADEFRRK